MLFWWFVVWWSAALLLYIATRVIGKQTTAAPSHSDNTRADASLPVSDDFVERSNGSASAHHESMWHILSAFLERFEEDKTQCGKCMQHIYRAIVPLRWRERASAEEGHGGLLVGVVRLRFLLVQLSRIGVFFCLLAPILAALFLYPHVWMGAVIYGGIPPPPTIARTETTITSSNGAYYEWHTVSNVQRVVPLCTHYDEALSLYESETEYLLARDMLRDEKRHSRCVVRLGEDGGHVFAYAPFDGVHAGLTRAPILSSVLLEQHKSYSSAALALNMSDAWRRPTIYVLRDGTRFLRLAVRITRGDKSTIERRLVSIPALLDFVKRWQTRTAKQVPGTTLQYCMCAAFLGILDPIFFYRDAATNEWQLWISTEVTSNNTVTPYYGTKQEYSESVAPLPYWQNKWLVEDAPDPHGTEHVVAHYDAISVMAIDVASTSVPSSAEIDNLERFWLGHGTTKRTHDPNAPFALAVPLDASRRTAKKLSGRDETGCFYHCDHVSLLMERVGEQG